MKTCTIVATTVLKSAPVPARSLGPAQRRLVAAGESLTLTDVYLDRDQHYCLELDAPVLADDGDRQLARVYVYAPHAAIEGFPESIKLGVPYYSQMNNAGQWYGSPRRQCCLTSNTMMADFLLGGEVAILARSAGFQQPESYYGKILAEKYGADTTDHDGHTECLRSEFSIDSYWSRSLSASDLRHSLRMGCPIVIGVAFKGSGHIVCVVGFDDAEGEWLIHDPYGIRYGASDRYDAGADGSYDRYSQSTMDRIFWDGGGEAGWGRIVVSIGELTTGNRLNF